MSVNDPMMESKHHDPMLDGIQTFKMGPRAYREVVVLFSDLPALIEKVREDERRKADDERIVQVLFHAPDDGARPFVLQRIIDVSGVSGTGVVAHGVEFPDGCVALRWVGGNPTSVVFHDNGMASVEAIHGHGGNTRIVWTYEDLGPRAAEMDEVQALGREQGQRGERERIRTGVTGLDAFYTIEECEGSPLEKGDPNDSDPWRQGYLLQRDEVLAVIDGEE